MTNGVGTIIEGRVSGERSVSGDTGRTGRFENELGDATETEP
ncbi:hypothetical protein [Natronorubrum halophilum]|nr:hypothetical protein [Natronorubrum halophilum]